ncbi:MAG: UbiA family prenyltransferase [Pedobacter sp.]|uniref:UbiA family prenyltransferase n=1 Tax=Pedobacter sp. TaxID=1411316 RepID=UPI0035634DED
MNLVKVIRSAEWWEYKLPPLLAIGYATAIKTDVDFLKSMPHLLFLLLSLIIGATYVSIINDITDIKDDLKSGKANRIAAVKPVLRWLLPLICLLVGSICCYILYPDWLSISLYMIPWISFSLYSFPPFRLKNRGIWGVLADASGSHIFTSLLMISSMSFISNKSIDWLWFISTGIWALCYGVRGILWHQFYDRANDIKAGLNTYGVKIAPKDFKIKEAFIFAIELLAVVTMLYCVHELLPILFLFIYLLVAYTRTYVLKYKPVIIVSPKSHPYHILMGDFYQVYFPISLLCTATINNNYALVILIIHLFLFPKKALVSLKDLTYLIRTK